MYDRRIREEGRAAKKIGLPESANPYRKAADQTGESILYEHALEWSNGWHISIPLTCAEYHESKGAAS